MVRSPQGAAPDYDLVSSTVSSNLEVIPRNITIILEERRLVVFIESLQKSILKPRVGRQVKSYSIMYFEFLWMVCTTAAASE